MREAEVIVRSFLEGAVNQGMLQLLEARNRCFLIASRRNVALLMP